MIKSLTLKNITVTRLYKISNEMVSINILKFVVEIINYATISTMFTNKKSICKHEYHFLLNWTDNKTAQA